VDGLRAWEPKQHLQHLAVRASAEVMLDNRSYVDQCREKLA
jgi:hypothetical protein